MNFLIKSGISIAISSIVLSGCASHAYKCDLDDDGSTNPNCKNPVEIYKAAVKGGGDRISIFSKDGENGSASDDSVFSPKIKVVKPFHLKELENKFNYEQSLKPKFIPPQVHRVWIPPYQDDYGYLHREDVVYYKIPGRFVTGNLNDNGIAFASGTDMGPAEPNNLGVNAKIINDDEKDSESMKKKQFIPSPSMTQQKTTYPLNMMKGQ